jgi:hypothetical protein
MVEYCSVLENRTPQTSICITFAQMDSFLHNAMVIGQGVVVPYCTCDHGEGNGWPLPRHIPPAKDRPPIQGFLLPKQHRFKTINYSFQPNSRKGSQISSLCLPTTQHFVASSTISCGGVGGPFSASEEHRQATMPVGPVHLHRVPSGRGTSCPATAPDTGRRHVLGEVTGCRLCLERCRYRDLLRERPHNGGRGRRQRRDGGMFRKARGIRPQGQLGKGQAYEFPPSFFRFVKRLFKKNRRSWAPLVNILRIKLKMYFSVTNYFDFSRYRIFRYYNNIWLDR